MGRLNHEPKPNHNNVRMRTAIDDDNRTDAELLTDAEYAERSPSKARYGDNSGYGWSPFGGETRFREVACPLCGANHTVWYRRHSYTDGLWMAFDSSYFRAFNDEPNKEDEPTRDVTVKDAVREYIERHGVARAPKVAQPTETKDDAACTLAGISVSETSGTATIKES